MAWLTVQLARRWLPAVLLCVLLPANLTVAQEQEEREESEKENNEPVYAGGNATAPSGKRAYLDVSDEQVMRILWHEGVWELPYRRITNLYISVSRPSAMVELGGSLLTAPFMLGALKDRKLFLSVSYHEVNEAPGKCIFLVRQGFGKSVELLAERSSQKLVFETYDAKRRLIHPK